MIVQAELRALHCPAIDDLASFRPNDDFGIFVQALIGPKDSKGEEAFGMMVCTPQWFATNQLSEIKSGRHVIFMKSFNYKTLIEFVKSYCEECKGESWNVVAQKLSRLGHWEFEDYRPFGAKSNI